jgi:hypothetical protein
MFSHKFLENKKSTMVFIDLEKTYDKSAKECHVMGPEKDKVNYIIIIKDTYNNVVTSI